MAQYQVVHDEELEGRKDRMPCILPQVVLISVKIFFESASDDGDRNDGEVEVALIEGDKTPGLFLTSLVLSVCTVRGGECIDGKPIDQKPSSGLLGPNGVPAVIDPSRVRVLENSDGLEDSSAAP